MNDYLDLARLGRNEWWRYLVAVITILFAWQIVGSGPSLILILWTMLDGNPATSVTPEATFTGIPVTVSFVAFMLASWAFLAGIFLAIRFIHLRKFLSLVTPLRKLDWKRLFQGFVVWFVLAAMVAIVESLFHPGRYVLTLDLGAYIPFVLLAVILLPIQTSAEELFFRGYLLQTLGLRIRNIWILSAISGIVFMLPHLLNPEARLNFILMGLYYFCIGATMAFITLKDGRLELALGLHAANNLFTGMFANTVVTVLPTPSMFTVMELDVVYSVTASIVMNLIFLMIFIGPMRGKTSKSESEQSIQTGS
jgi:hypothetical protein